MSSLRVRLLGDLVVEGRDAASLGRRQARTVIKVLALQHGRPVRVDRLAECVWGEEPPARAADQISVLVSRLRGVLGSDRIRRSDAGYTLTVDWLDVDALEAYAAEAERRLDAGTLGAARAAGSAGLGLVRGRFLADESDAWWADADAARVDRLLARLHDTAGRAALASGDATAAVDLAEAALRADPFNEVALRLSMSALAASGRPASALAAYARFRADLAEELGVSPSPDTEALHQRLLVGNEPPHAAGPKPTTPRGADLPGRAEPLEQLDALVARAMSGEMQVAIVEGEAGIGKSRVLDAFGYRAASCGVAVVRAAGDELGRTLPLQPLLDAVFELGRQDGAADPESALGPDASLLAPLLGYRGQPLATTQLAALTGPGAGQAVLFAAVNNVLRHRAQQSPLAVVIDDLHLAGPSTLAWLAQAGKRLAGCRLAIVAARRAEEASAVPGAEVIRLGPLDLEATAEIVGAERALDLYRRSNGHPLFLVELAAAAPDDQLPASILQAVDDRCARAGPAAATLRTAAVLGARVDLDLLAAVTELSPVVLLDHLEEGRRRLLLVEGANFEFRHSLVRQALASTVGPARTSFIHRQASRALRARSDADPLIVAHHARLGGDRELASAMLIIAARAAVARFGQAEAATLLDQAIELADGAQARIERARVRSMLLRYADAQDDIEAAQAMGAGAEALEAGAWAAHFQRRFDEALRLADRGADEADDAELRASCLGLGGWVSLATGDLAGSRQRLAQAAREQPANRLVQAWLGWLRVNEGRPDQTAAMTDPEAGHGLAAYRFPNAYALMAATMALAMVGRPDEALAAAARLDSETRRMGATRWFPRPQNLRGWIVRNLGETTEADELNLAALELARPLQLAEPLANGVLDLAAGRLWLGDLDGATARLDEAAALSDVDHGLRWRHQLRQRLLRARVDLASGRPEAAWSAANSLADDARDRGVPRCDIQACLLAAIAGAALRAAGDGPPPPDLNELSELLDRLGGVAGMEAWWMTAEVAGAFGVDAWMDLARRRVADLLPRAGLYRDSLLRAAERRGLT